MLNEIYKVKSQNSEIIAATLCLGECFKRFFGWQYEKDWIYKYVYDFSVDYDSIDIDEILDIHLIKKKKKNIK